METPPIASVHSAGLDIKYYFRLAWRWAWLIILCTALAGIAAYFVSINLSPTYRATARVMINEARNPALATYNDLLTSERSARTYAQLMARPTMLRQTLSQLGMNPDAVGEHLTSVNITPMRDTQLVEVSIEGPNPQLVAAVANLLPENFMAELRAIQLERFAESKASLQTQMDALNRQIEETQVALGALRTARTPQDAQEFSQLNNQLSQYQTSYSGLLQNYETLRLAEAQSMDNIVVVEPATPPGSPIRPRVLVNTLLAAIVGGMLALGGIFLMEYLDDRVQSPEDLARITDMPVLGTITQLPAPPNDGTSGSNLIAVQQPRHPTVEAYRRLRTNLRYYNVDTSLQSLVVTSAAMGEGKSTTAANLAVVMAQSGLSVVLVDADLRRPTQHRLFGLNQSPGVTDAVMADDVRSYLQTPKINVSGLQVLTAGDEIPFPAEILGSQRMRTLMQQLSETADLVIFDTPPLLAVTDAQIMGSLASGTLIVIDTQRTTTGSVYQALESLVQINVPIVGALLNRLSDKARGYYTYGYGYGYGDYFKEGKQGKGSRTPAGAAASVAMSASTKPNP